MEKKTKAKDYTPYSEFSLYYSESKKKKKTFNVDKEKGIKLDIGCGSSKQPNYVGLDIRPLECVDIVHDLEKIPYPIPDESCLTILASHIVEHINPSNFGLIKVINEWWRIMKPHGRLMITCPYGMSRGFIQDPTHLKPVNEDTFTYFDPTHRNGFWAIYMPHPWKIIANAWSVDGTIEVVMEKMPKEDVKVEGNKIIINSSWFNVKGYSRNSDKL